MPIDKITDLENQIQVRNVIVSVADKRGIEKLAPRLLELCPGLRFYATGGTFRALREVIGLDAPQHLVEMTRYCIQPVTKSGLARTVDFKVYIGLLADPFNEIHVADLSKAGAVFFDMVISNLAPFPEAEDAAGVDDEERRLMIDIGGPGMIRGGMSNYLRVATVTDPDDYDRVLERIEQLNGQTDLELRHELARKAAQVTARNAAAIARYFEELTPETLKDLYAFTQRSADTIHPGPIVPPKML